MTTSLSFSLTIPKRKDVFFLAFFIFFLFLLLRFASADDADYVAITVAPPPPSPLFPNVEPGDEIPEKAAQDEKEGDPDPWLTPLLTRFGFTDLKPFQIECLRHVRDRKDVFLIADTGLGKSAVFQGLIDVVEPFDKSITLVVSPLKSLCRDQVASCGKHPIPILAKHLETIEHLDELVVHGHYNMLYLAPELLETPEFLAMLETEAYQTRLKTVVIDEVRELPLYVVCAAWRHVACAAFLLLSCCRLIAYHGQPFAKLGALAT